VEEVGQFVRAMTGENVGLHILISDARRNEVLSYTIVYVWLGKYRIGGLPPGLVRSSPEEDIRINWWTGAHLCQTGVSPLVCPSPGLHGPGDIATMSILNAGEAVKGLREQGVRDPN
jgi:hypothetical protein